MTYREMVQIMVRAIGEDAATRAAEAICREAAGERVHIPARPGPPEIRPDDTTATVRARYQVPRSTAASWVRRWR